MDEMKEDWNALINAVGDAILFMQLRDSIDERKRSSLINRLEALKK